MIITEKDNAFRISSSNTIQNKLIGMSKIFTDNRLGGTYKVYSQPHNTSNLSPGVCTLKSG